MSSSNLELSAPMQVQQQQLQHLALIIIVLLFLSNIIESKFHVKTLPGLAGDLPFTLETGYIGVGELENVQLFYYFIESERNPKDDPLMLWLTGGPGCSALSGILYEIGPFTFDYANSSKEIPTLELNPYSWTKVANIIFLDQPAGTGFSYAKTSNAYISSDTMSVAQTHDFLRKWLMDHPKFLDSPLYIAGDSYVGQVVPIIVQEIYNGNEVGSEPWMNIKGYMLGNPLTDKNTDYNSRLTFAHRTALLSDAIFESTQANCHGEYLDVNPSNRLCINDLQVVRECLGRISYSHILEPWCESGWDFKTNIVAWDISYSKEKSLPPRQRAWCRDDNYVYSEIWANSREVQEALHIHEVANNKEWMRCNKSIIYHDGAKQSVAYTYNVQNSVGYHRNLSDKNCRALIYSGDHDMKVPYVGTEEWIESLNVPVEIYWRAWLVEGQVAGYTMKYSKKDYELTFATIKGGGHTAPEYKPKQCLAMVSRWFGGYPL